MVRQVRRAGEPTIMPPPIDLSRDLLFGLLALQNGLINQVQLVVAFQAWTLQKDRPLADHLVCRGDLDADDRAAVAVLVARHLKRHGGDAEKSLGDVRVEPSIRRSLAAVIVPRIDATLLGLFFGPETNRDPDLTASYSVGAATSDGQRFRILRPHAQGGLGAVFVALDEELHREVALQQILDHHADDPNSRARFLLEAEVTGGLEHPGIVPVYGLGAYPDGRPYYAMRFIRGDSLKEAIAAFHADDTLRADPGRRALGLLKLLRRFLAVCDAIDYAHSRGILHSDLKPSNVILGKHGETLVVDWGLAKALGRTESDVTFDERILVPSLSSGSAETLPGSALGTPTFMSPEQAQGDLERLGPRSDVYSLGATLYCLLTGRPPVEDDDVGAVLRAVKMGDFPPPRRLDPALDPALEAICLKAMALRAEDRYPTPRTLADDIEHWMADEPVAAWREPWARRARRWERRHRTAVMAAASGLLMALAGMFSVLVVQARANSDLTRSNNALAAANERERERERFNLAMDAVRLFHGEVSEDLLLKEKSFEALRTKLLRGAAGFYTKLEGMLAGQTDPASRAALGRAYETLGELTDNIGSKPEALAVHRKALAVRRALAAAPEADAATQVDVARSLLAVGWLQFRNGEMSGARASYDETLRLAEGLMAKGSAGDQLQAVQGLAHQRIGELFFDTGKPAEAQAAFERSIAVRQKLADAHPDDTQFQSDLGAGYHEIGSSFKDGGKPGEALAAYERALVIRQKLADADPSVARLQSDLALSHHHIGYTLYLAGWPAEAMAALKRALAIRQKLADANPNATDVQYELAHIHNVLGWALERNDKPDEALAAFERAIGIVEKLADAYPTVTSWHSELANNLSQVGGIHLKAGRTAEAVASIRRAVAIWMRLSSRTPTDLYNLSCSHASLSTLAAEPGSGMTAAEAPAEADRAMEWLRQAVVAGIRKLAVLRTDHSLDPLRSRPDFQLLLMDLAMPDDPFAKDTDASPRR
jgi:serine/threonine-protein kinase